MAEHLADQKLPREPVAYVAVSQFMQLSKWLAKIVCGTKDVLPAATVANHWTRLIYAMHQTARSIAAHAMDGISDRKVWALDWALELSPWHNNQPSSDHHFIFVINNNKKKRQKKTKLECSLSLAFIFLLCCLFTKRKTPESMKIWKCEKFV